MSYQWANDKMLDLLDAQGSNNKLIFNTEMEKATVYIVDNDIESVNYEYNNQKFIIDKKKRHHIVVGEGNSKRDV